MKDFYEFATNSPWLTFFLGWFACLTLVGCAHGLGKLAIVKYVREVREDDEE